MYRDYFGTLVCLSIIVQQTLASLPPLVPEFNVPYSVTICGNIYLSGYSYYKTQNGEDPAGGQQSCFRRKRKKNPRTVADLRYCIENQEISELVELLDSDPELPNYLLDSEGKCDQAIHQALLGILLLVARISDLNLLYGIRVSTTVSTAAEDDKISYREMFGTRSSLVHENILVRKISTQNRVPIRCLSYDHLIGKGSFGHVFNIDGALVKFSHVTSEYIRELLSQCVLSATEDSLCGVYAKSGITQCTSALPQEVHSPTTAPSDFIHHHLLSLKPLQPLTRISIIHYITTILQQQQSSRSNSGGASAEILIRRLLHGIRALRDRFVMHLDISTNNIMWDPHANTIRLIDYGGTIGDDSFIDIGTNVTKLCTRSTRPPEYNVSTTLWQRNENSESLSAYYAVMGHIFPVDLLNEPPFNKEYACRKIVEKDTTTVLTCEADRQIHLFSRSNPQERPLLDWVLDGEAGLSMGIIGSLNRYRHMRQCLFRFVSMWPRRTEPLEDIWKTRRSLFISILLPRISCMNLDDGTTCGGLIQDYIIPPPYTAARCLTLYDALRDLITCPKFEPLLTRYLTETSYYRILVNTILYISLSPSKPRLYEVEYYSCHPLHTVLRAITQYPHLISCFLSPITVFTLLHIETPKILKSSEQPGDVVHQPILRCLYSLKPERRMYNESVDGVAGFVRKYLSHILREPLLISSKKEWWKFLIVEEGTTGGGGGMSSPETPLSREATNYVESVIRLWF